MPNTTPSMPKIAIIGAGPSGLCLANILQKNNIPFAIYEADTSPHARNQGGTLDLHPEFGQLALREAGLWDAFVKHARPESDVLKVVKHDGEVLWDGNGADKKAVPEHQKFDQRPEIDRARLIDILEADLKPEAFRWGKKLVEAQPARGETFDLHFADGTVEEAVDLVVGSEGAWSKVRKLLTDERPHYSGISAIELWALDVDKNPKYEWMKEYVGAGSLFSFGEGRSIQIQRIGDGSIRTYGCLRVPETFLRDCGIDWTQPQTARREYVERYFGDCGEGLKRMMLESEDELVPRALYMLPVGFSWKSRPGVTLLGDAAHLMTPFAGVGVNAALSDALALGRTIVAYVQGSGHQSLAKAVEAYDTELFSRGEKFATKTFNNMRKHFSAGGSEFLAGRLRAAYGNTLAGYEAPLTTN